MRIRLGLHLDGQHGWHPSNRLGFPTLGPLGFLGILETQLGLTRENASQSERIVQYRECLKRCDNEDRFYHRTFETDELGTAATLLGWRDLWHLNGWSKDISKGAGRRLQDMADVEKLAVGTVGPGIGERLSKVLKSMDQRKVPIEEIVLVDPLEAFPARWRDVLAKLPLALPEEVVQRDTADTLLGELQRALVKVQAGETLSQKIKWKNDGSVVIAQAETRFLAGSWLNERMAISGKEGLLVSSAQGELLDGILVASDAARQGFREASAFRPTLQVLPLALEIIWEPLNFYGLLQFLTHPVCPVPFYVRRQLAAKLADKPGIGGASWEAVLKDIDEHYKEKAKEIRETVHLWVEHARYSQENGAPTVDVLQRVRHVTDFFRNRLGETDVAARVAFNAGFAQCKACADALEGLIKQGVETIRPRQLQKLVVQATARGSDNPLHEPEVGALMAVTDPAAAIECFDRVLWWQLGMPSMPTGYPLSKQELVGLEAAGVTLPTLSYVLDGLSKDWQKPILAAKQELVLVLPPKGEEVHPVFLMIEALIDKVSVTPLESILTEVAAGHPVVKHTPLPQQKRWWRLPEGIELQKKGRDSYSSLEIQIFNPYQWLLKYPAALRPSRILSVSNDFRLFGNLAHGLVDRFFQQSKPLLISDNDLLAWFETTFDRLIEEEGAVLRMRGRQSDLEGFRMNLRESIRQLRLLLTDANIVRVIPEMELTGHYAGGELHGYADLVLEKSSGEQAIVDMKWSGAKKYPEKLEENRQLQLAIYAELLRQNKGKWPDIAYYILDCGKLFALDDHYFPTAQTVRRKTDEGTADLWLRFVETWKWRQEQITARSFEVVIEGIPDDEDSTVPPDALPVEYLPPQYNDYLALAGWKE